MKVTVLRGLDQQYYFRFTAANGRIVAVGGEGYTRAASAERAWKRFLATARAAFPQYARRTAPAPTRHRRP